MSPKIISIEGNIGSGKTTIIDKLTKHFENDDSLIFLREPVDIWENIKDIDGKNILQKFYENPEEYAFSFQIMALTTRLELIKNKINENPDCSVIICERSLEADKEIFAKMLYGDNKIKNIDYQIYNQLYNEFTKKYQAKGIIYLETTPDVCYERMGKRNRLGEEGVTLDYLKECNKYHTNWLGNPSGLGSKNVLKIDANENVSDEEDDIIGMKWIEDIKEFIETVNEDENILHSIISRTSTLYTQLFGNSAV